MLTSQDVSTAADLAQWVRDELSAPVPQIGHIIRVLTRETTRWQSISPEDLSTVLTDEPISTGDTRWDALVEALSARAAHLMGCEAPAWTRRTRLEDAWYPWEATVTDPRWQIAAVVQTPAEMLHRGVILPLNGLKLL